MRGKAAPTDLRSDVDGDHPRTCGEKAMYEYGNNTAEGSPPHVRGKEVDTVTETAVTGITPACAGKSALWPCSMPCCRDHPRMCGEKNGTVQSKRRSIGSPPHVRGKDTYCTFLNSSPGITPACAGKSQSEPETNARRKDHPRMCGEKTL